MLGDGFGLVLAGGCGPVGGEIAANLASLYEYVFHEILKMQVDEDPVHADHCRQVLEPQMLRKPPPPPRLPETPEQRPVATRPAPLKCSRGGRVAARPQVSTP